MKKSHLLLIGIIAVAVMVIVSTAGDASTYVSFREAREMSENGNKNKSEKTAHKYPPARFLNTLPQGASG